ncbi:sensor histidine kinase [Georgenia thermotolerans]|uniref:sensor histidine kinase n=1 Tax=Georgenia thermotolerans TaxID=527326 RepID=UPI0014796B1A|nr:histidine kinase [Georgenia thermotolerans]
MRIHDGLSSGARRADVVLPSGVRRSDVVLTAGFLLVGLAQMIWFRPVSSLWWPDSSWFGVVLAVVSVLPLAWRRARPVGAAVVGSSLWWVPTDGFLLLGYACAVLLFFSVGRRCPDGRLGALACGWAMLSGACGFVTIEQAENRLVDLLFDFDVQQMAVELRIPDGEVVFGIVGFWLLVLGSYGVGRLLAAQDREAQERIATERETARRDAVEEERARIVRELHDVVGHEVTLMSIQSEAAAQALELAPERAAVPVAAVRETAHRASRELRAILDLLGDGELAVAPDERGLAELVDRAGRLGIANRLVVTGEPWTDTPRHWLAVNRIVQEGLTNAGKHAAGERVDVTVDWSDAGVRVRVVNPAAAAARPGSGHGLPGMAERARLLGGTLDAGQVDGRFEVDAWLPAPAEAER